jgi:uncharacterized damage-inducible protein DinB
MQLQQSTFQILGQLLTVLQQLKPEEYRSPLSILSGETIGRHARHVVEFYHCLQLGLELGFIDYDERKRDLLIEQQLGYGIDSIEKVITFVINSSKDYPLSLKVCYDQGGEKAEVMTTFYRELSYNIEHVIHHLALIKIALEQHFPEVIIPDDFGIAYSTLSYRQACAQ